MRTVPKDPDAVLDFTQDWSKWLGTDTITASDWVLESGITEDSSTNNTTSATVWLSGGTDGCSYTVTNRITTTAGRIDDRSFVVAVKER